MTEAGVIVREILEDAVLLSLKLEERPSPKDNRQPAPETRKGCVGSRFSFRASRRNTTFPAP